MFASGRYLKTLSNTRNGEIDFKLKKIADPAYFEGEGCDNGGMILKRLRNFWCSLSFEVILFPIKLDRYNQEHPKTK